MYLHAAPRRRRRRKREAAAAVNFASARRRRRSILTGAPPPVAKWRRRGLTGNISISGQQLILKLPRNIETVSCVNAQLRYTLS